MSDKYWDYMCKFCGERPPEFKFFPKFCSCDAAVAFQEKAKESVASEPTVVMDEEEYNKQYPVIYEGERLIVASDLDSHKLRLEARKYSQCEILCVWIPFTHEDENGKVDEGAGRCWDFSEFDAGALYDLLGEYLEKK